jgi:hypothetical protein
VTRAFYFDEDAMHNSLLRALRARHIDVQSALEAGMIRRRDEEHLEYAAQQGRTLYSYNVAHFCRIHADWLTRGELHSGIVLAQQQRFSVGTQVRALLRLAAKCSQADMQNRLEFLGDWI